LKQEYYGQLPNKLKEIDPTADINKTKINTLRSNYRRELKKVLASEKSIEGTVVPTIYTCCWFGILFHSYH